MGNGVSLFPSFQSEPLCLTLDLEVEKKIYFVFKMRPKVIFPLKT